MPRAATIEPARGGTEGGSGWHLASWIALFLIVAWQAFLAFGGSLESSLNWTIDDAFYYLKVADSVSRGLGSTFDGRHGTNGYHPLWMLVLIPFLSLTRGDPVTGFRVIQGLQLLILAGALLVQQRCARRLLSPPAAFLSLVFVAWPRILTQTNSLLESGLLLLLLFVLLDRTLPSAGNPTDRVLPARFIDGLLLGAIVLCRLDAAFLVVAYALAATVAGTQRLSSRRSLTPLLLPVAVPVGAYLAWNLWRFGRLMPVSGVLKTTFPRVEPQWHYLRQFADFFLLAALGGLLWVRERLRDLRPSAPAIFGFAACLHILYTLLFMKWGVENWYFCLAIPGGTLLLAQLAVALVERGFAAGTRTRRAATVVLASGVLLVASASLVASRARHRDLILQHYFRAAIWARDHTPRDAVFAMTDAGIFAWFSGRTTINTDGLINDFDFLDALRRGDFAAYVRREGVDYIASSWNRTPELLHGGYGAKTIRARLRPDDLDGGSLEMSEHDEVYRDVFTARLPPSRQLVENAILIWKFSASS